MSCISADGTLSESGLKMVRALKNGSRTPEDIAKETGLPLFRVRSGLRDLLQAGAVTQDGNSYLLTEKGLALIS